jgi:hypothetical protein
MHQHPHRHRDALRVRTRPYARPRAQGGTPPSRPPAPPSTQSIQTSTRRRPAHRCFLTVATSSASATIPTGAAPPSLLVLLLPLSTPTDFDAAHRAVDSEPTDFHASLNAPSSQVTTASRADLAPELPALPLRSEGPHNLQPDGAAGCAGRTTMTPWPPGGPPSRRQRAPVRQRQEPTGRRASERPTPAPRLGTARPSPSLLALG